jgi:hypothetical protein
MRTWDGGVAHLANAIEQDLRGRQTGLYKPDITGISDLVACVLTTKSVNSGEWIAVLPRSGCNDKSKERYISRHLSKTDVSPLAIISPLVSDIVSRLSSTGETVILMMDQSQIKTGVQCLMVSLRLNQRAIPVAWKVVETLGNIGFCEQSVLLQQVVNMLPKPCNVLLSADRFYGTAMLIGWCQQQNWDYRIRLKGNLTLTDLGSELTTGEAAKLGWHQLCMVGLGEVKTNIGICHEAGHPEPWIIAMGQTATKARVLDYGMRWGIEAMFSDFKSRGFGITKTHLTHPNRIEHLILILSIACYWAVSTGLFVKADTPLKHTQKKPNAPLSPALKQA